jgi:hypothetical protein
VKKTIAIFGESKEGPLHTFIHLRSLPHIVESFGNPTETGLGIHLAIQALLFQREVLFYRLEEEGFQKDTYELGCHLLEKHPKKEELTAIALPGVGDTLILSFAQKVAAPIGALLLITAKDLYDFTTQR